MGQRCSPAAFITRCGLPKGRKPATHSFTQDGELFENAVVIKDIKQTLAQECRFYGYHNMTDELKEVGWIANHKK